MEGGCQRGSLVAADLSACLSVELQLKGGDCDAGGGLVSPRRPGGLEMTSVPYVRLPFTNLNIKITATVCAGFEL